MTATTGGARPAALPVLPENIPADVKALPGWFLWRFEWRAGRRGKPGKWTKPPRQPDGRLGKTNDPNTWSSFAAVLDKYRRGGWDGIGCVLPEGFVGIDLDEARGPDGALKPWAQDLVVLINTYTEGSPSGTGVKAWARARKRAPACRRKYHDGEVEVYDHASPRYFTVTGQRLDGAPALVNDRQEAVGRLCELVFPGGPEPRAAPARPPLELDDEQLLGRARKAANGAAFAALFDRGDVGGYASESEADLALCNHLAFWCGRDRARMERLFAASALGGRPKWRRQDYRDRTLGRAIKDCGNVYEPRAGAGRAGGPRKAAAEAHEGNGKAHGPGEVPLGPLLLRPAGRARQTDSGKISLPASAYEGRVLRYSFVVTSADSSRRGPARTLAAMAAVEVEEADGALIRLHAAAAERLQRGEEQSGPTIAEVLAERVPPLLRLTHRTERGGLWSEVLGREVPRGEFTNNTPSALLDACGGCRDCPRTADGSPARGDLLAAIKNELGVLWSDLMGSLPAASFAELSGETEAAILFRNQLRDLWRKPATFEVRKEESGTTATRATLVSRVGTLRKQGKGAAVWRAVHDAFDAWWRLYVDRDGEERVGLAMRHGLAAQLSGALTGVTDQASLVRLGRGCGCLASDAELSLESLPDRLSGGGRLAVLSREMVDDLLSEPNECLNEPASDTSDSPDGVTGEKSDRQEGEP